MDMPDLPSGVMNLKSRLFYINLDADLKFITTPEILRIAMGAATSAKGLGHVDSLDLF
jgi:hypothetical protein